MPKYPSIYKKQLKSGIKYYGAKWHKGKTYTTKLYSKAVDAAGALEELNNQLKKDVLPEKKHITVRDFTNLYFQKYLSKKPGIQHITLKNIRSGLISIIKIIGKLKLSDLTPEVLQDLQNKMLEHYDNGTVKVRLNEFRRVLKRAVKWKYIPYDPSADLDPIYVDTDSKKPDILEKEQIAYILNNEDIQIRERSIIGLGALAGLRISEIFALKWKKIDFQLHTIHIDLQYCEGELKSPKKSSLRTIQIIPELEPILKECRLQSKSFIWLFPSCHNKPLSPQHWSRYYFRPLLKRLGLPVVYPHSLRHLFDKMMHDAGIPTRDVMNMMGHKQAKMTLHYDRAVAGHLVDITRDLKIL